MSGVAPPYVTHPETYRYVIGGPSGGLNEAINLAFQPDGVLCKKRNRASTEDADVVTVTGAEGTVLSIVAGEPQFVNGEDVPSAQTFITETASASLPNAVSLDGQAAGVLMNDPVGTLSVASTTGTGNVVCTNGPTLVAPHVGEVVDGDVTNCVPFAPLGGSASEHVTFRSDGSTVNYSSPFIGTSLSSPVLTATTAFSLTAVQFSSLTTALSSIMLFAAVPNYVWIPIVSYTKMTWLTADYATGTGTLSLKYEVVGSSAKMIDLLTSTAIKASNSNAENIAYPPTVSVSNLNYTLNGTAVYFALGSGASYTAGAGTFAGNITTMLMKVS